MERGTPIITDMQVIPVAGYDSMLLTLSGAHAPFFTRNIVLLTDSSGNTGLGEVHGGDAITAALEGSRELVMGRAVGEYKEILRDLGRLHEGGDGEGLQGLDLKKLQFVVHAETAVESALLDLLGKFMGLPVSALLGGGRQREKIQTLGYLFYVADKGRTPLPYLDERGSNERWFRQRRSKALEPEEILEQAHAAKERYGFECLKLKGGVQDGEREMETVRLLKREFPAARINIDPNGAWSLRQAVELCCGMRGILSYCEDPCSGEQGFSGREIMAEFKRQTGLPVATNMIATDWRQLRHSVLSHSVDIVLADPHFWTMEGSVRAGQVLRDFGLQWGSHSNNHFDISLAIFAQTAAAVPGEITAMDTHWIWQDGQYLTREPMEIKNGYIELPDRPGLGVEADMDRILAAHALYCKLGRHDRDDAAAMQYLIPGWTFDPKRPCLVR
ncbi:enolase C-terminal domain-like protein [Harryflintia acetispora]|uniref:enolase C-terminal domain-like protein n=1 Tax=Harryflintia acetispora TaxID=1849041 RepID=UPI00189B9DDF|nr:enolase C-terminal domain-like protein [Harryflintia acetispora]